MRVRPGAGRRAGGLLATVLCALSVAQAAVAQDQGGFEIRSSDLGDDGTTTIVVSLAEELDAPLTAEGVQVTEAGTAIEELQVEPIGETAVEAPPVSLALVIDISGSTEGEPLAAAKEAAKGFLDQLEEINASVALIAFSDEANVVAPFTTDLPSLDAPIDSLEADGETALYDAVQLAAQQVGQTQEDAQRMMVVFSDGADTVSDASQQQAITASQNNAAPITSVILTSPDLELEPLEALATGSGGSAIAVGTTEELAGAFETVAAELTNQYVITYTSDVTEPRELNLEVTIGLPSGEATQTFTVLNTRRPPPEAVPPPAVEANPGLIGSGTGLILGMVAAFVALAALMYTLLMTPRTQAAKLLDRELNRYIEGGRKRADSSAVAEALRRRATAVLERSPSAAAFHGRIQKTLDQGRLPLKTVEFLAILVVGGLLLGSIGLLLVGWRGALVFAPVGILAPILFVLVKRARRLARFYEMLPDTLQLMAGSLSAGYGVLQSIDMVTKESEDPMSTEFNRVLVESRLGMPLEESLENMAERMDSADFRWVVLAMNIQREVGGNLAQLMQTVATTLREREALRRHIKALAAEGKLSAIVLVALPIFLAGYLVLVNPEYVGTLVESLIGWVMIIGGIIGMIIGIFWIRGLIRAIEV